MCWYLEENTNECTALWYRNESFYAVVDWMLLRHQRVSAQTLDIGVHSTHHFSLLPIMNVHVLSSREYIPVSGAACQEPAYHRLDSRSMFQAHVTSLALSTCLQSFPTTGANHYNWGATTLWHRMRIKVDLFYQTALMTYPQKRALYFRCYITRAVETIKSCTSRYLYRRIGPVEMQDNMR